MYSYCLSINEVPTEPIPYVEKLNKGTLHRRRTLLNELYQGDVESDADYIYRRSSDSRGKNTTIYYMSWVSPENSDMPSIGHTVSYAWMIVPLNCLKFSIMFLVLM